jgi:hypothetical protein
VSSAVGLIVLSRRLARDPRWLSIATYTRMAGAVSVVGFVVMGALVMPDDAPLHEWAGLAQRLLILVVLFPCRVVLSLRLLQVASGNGRRVRRVERDICEVVGSTGYVLRFLVNGNSKRQPVDAARMRGTPMASVLVYLKMMSVLPTAGLGRASQNVTFR